MSKISKLVGSVTKMLGLSAPKPPKMPEAVIPATPAAVPQTNAGANIVLGTPIDTSRVSGSGSPKKKLDPLGMLGLGGLSI